MVFGPQEFYEREGDVDDVVFPCGWVYNERQGKLKYIMVPLILALQWQRQILAICLII